MNVKYCREYSIEDFETMLAKATNDGVALIFDGDGWSYGSTEEFGDVTNEMIERLIEDEIKHPIDDIYIDVTSDVVIVTFSI